MRTSIFKLADYTKTDDYIRQCEEELKYPYKENELNNGIKGVGGNSEVAANLLITIEQDRCLASLERNPRIINEAMDVASEDTMTIIQELYFKKRPRYTMQGLIDNKLIYCGRSQAFRLRNEFFEDIAKELNLEI